MKKRNINKIILTSMTLFSFVGVTLPFVANSNSSINKIDNVRLGGTITLKAGAEEKLKLMYPFELNNTNFNEFFTIEGVPSDNVATYEFINQDNATGKILIRIRGNRIFNPSTGEATSIDWDTTLGSIDGPPAIFKIVPDMKISGGTELRSVGATNPIITNAYASDVYVSKPGTSPPSASSVEYTRVTTLINQMIKTIPGINKTSITINPDTDLLANNNLGTLTIRYKLTNYFSTNPTSTFIQGESGNIQLDLEGFKTVPGPTGLLVSGEVSNKIAAIMQKMSNNMQVIAITHLPQIAAKGKNHYKVFKEEINGITTTNLKQLSDNERIVEIAEILSGKEVYDTTLINDKDLLN